MKNYFAYSIFLLFLIFISSNIFADELIKIHEKTYSTKNGLELKITTSIGDVYLSTWDKLEIYVKISGNRKAQEKIDFTYSNNENGLEITAKKEGGSWFTFGGAYLKYEIKLPKNYNSSIKTAGGDIKIYDLNGKINFTTSGGDVSLFNTVGDANVKTSGGDIKLSNTKGELNINTSGGDIDVNDFAGSLYASTSGGDIELNGGNGKIDASTSGGNVKLNYSGENKGIDLSTSGGDIDVSVPANFKAEADLSTSGGEIECELNVTKSIKIKSTTFKAEVNGGGNLIKCHTSGGDVTVKQNLNTAKSE